MYYKHLSRTDSLSGGEATLSLRNILLGLLSENSGHGYGLRKRFLHRLAHFRNINEGQLYTELAKMEKEGLIEREVVVPEKGPAKKLFHITPQGKRSFQDWLRSDQYEDGGVLYDFIHGYPFFTKCTFLQHLEPDEARQKITNQILQMERKKKAYEEILQRMERRQADPFRVRILAYGIREMELRIEWLKGLQIDLVEKCREAS